MVFPPKLNFIYYIVPAATFQVSPAGFLNFFVSLYFFRQFRRIFRAEIAEGPRVETVADAFGQRIVEVQVVHDRKPHGEHLFRLEQVVQIGTGIAPADRAVTLRVDGAVVAGVLGVFQVDAPLPGKQLRVPRVARGHDAVEEVHAPGDGLDDV